MSKSYRMCMAIQPGQRRRGTSCRVNTCVCGQRSNVICERHRKYLEHFSKIFWKWIRFMDSLPGGAGEVTVLLEQVRRGEEGALDRLGRVIYPELYRLAHARMGKEPAGHCAAGHGPGQRGARPAPRTERPGTVAQPALPVRGGGPGDARGSSWTTAGGGRSSSDSACGIPLCSTRSWPDGLR